MKKEYQLIAIIIVIAIVVGTIALVNFSSTGKKVTFEEITVTEVPGITEVTKPDSIYFYKNKTIVLGLTKDLMTPEVFDESYNALSGGQVTLREYVAAIPQTENVTWNNASIETYEGNPTITVHGNGSVANANGEIIIKMVRTNTTVYHITYFPDYEDSLIMYETIDFNQK